MTWSSTFRRWPASALVAMAVGLFVLPGAGSAQQASLQGIVLSSSTGGPMDGVAVILELAGQQVRVAFTDRNGFYQMGAIRPGTYSLRGQQLGYKPYQQTVTVVAGSRGRVNLRMETEPVPLEQAQGLLGTQAIPSWHEPGRDALLQAIILKNHGVREVFLEHERHDWAVAAARLEGEELGVLGSLHHHVGEHRVVAVERHVHVVGPERAEVHLRRARGGRAEEDVGELGGDHGAAPAVREAGAEPVEEDADVVVVHAHVRPVEHLDVLAVDAPRGDAEPLQFHAQERTCIEEAFAGDVVGIGIHTGNALRGYEIGRAARQRGAWVVFGGIHATMDPQETLSQACVDYICVGEGEEAILELIRNGSPQGVKNIGHKTRDGSVLEPLRPYTDITKLPFKDYEIFDFQKMIEQPCLEQPVNPKKETLR